jgi:RNA polymerase sigma factor (sigma-70 family)
MAVKELADKKTYKVSEERNNYVNMLVANNKDNPGDIFTEIYPEVVGIIKKCVLKLGVANKEGFRVQDLLGDMYKVFLVASERYSLDRKVHFLAYLYFSFYRNLKGIKSRNTYVSPLKIPKFNKPFETTKRKWDRIQLLRAMNYTSLYAPTNFDNGLVIDEVKAKFNTYEIAMNNLLMESFEAWCDSQRDITKNVMKLYYLKEMTIYEIADVLGMSKQGVFDQLKRHTAKLKDALALYL